MKTRKIMLIIFIITIAITFSSCGSIEKNKTSGNNSSEEVKEDETRLIDDAGLIVKYENRFKEYLPNMKIVAKEMADLDYHCKSRALGAEKVQPSQEISSFPNIQPILIHICINSEL